MGKNWKDSASLIILARNHQNIFANGFNYKVLLHVRTEKTHFMPNSSVFTGGATDPIDESKSWLTFFKSFGITDNQLKLLTNVKGTRPPIFKQMDNCIEREISLRITAIREAFEEIGVLFCRKKHELQTDDLYGKFYDNFDKKFWQEQVHNEPSKFLELCKKLNVIPDLWSLNEWAAWLSPASFPRRFETAFYLVSLNKIPDTLAEKQEVAKILWRSPTEYFQMFKEEKIWLPPPQCYELARLRQMPSIDVLSSFARERSSKGIILFLPVQYQCTDGVSAVLPGDNFYPENPNDFNKMVETNETMDEFRKRAVKLHRNEYSSFYSNVLHCNIESEHGHVKPFLSDIKSKDNFKYKL